MQILNDIHGGYKKIFLHLRNELIKSRGQVYQMMKGAGLPAPDAGGEQANEAEE
jgi:hypothetical protein